jgi:thioredoxin 1
MNRYVHDVSEAALDDVLLQSREPILVDFWAPWCAPCRAMAPALEAVAEKLAGAAKVYKLNVDDNPSVSPRFNVKGIPTLILFKDGREASRLVGLSSKDQIEALVTL